MATLTVRNVPERTYHALKVRAAEHGRSMEAEVRSILDGSVDTDGDPIGGWLVDTRTLRGAELETPRRSAGRGVDLA